jgi:hypothetical protein
MDARGSLAAFSTRLDTAHEIILGRPRRETDRRPGKG